MKRKSPAPPPRWYQHPPATASSVPPRGSAAIDARRLIALVTAISILVIGSLGLWAGTTGPASEAPIRVAASAPSADLPETSPAPLPRQIAASTLAPLPEPVLQPTAESDASKTPSTESRGLIPRLKPTNRPISQAPATQSSIAALAPAPISASANSAQTASDASSGFGPRLKPTKTQNNPQSNQFSDQSTFISAQRDLLDGHPLNLRPIVIADDANQPLPFFSSQQDPQPFTALNVSTALPRGDLPSDVHTQEWTLQKGESLADLLVRAGVRREDKNAAIAAIGKHLKLRRLQPGLTLTLTTSTPNQTYHQHLFNRAQDVNFLVQATLPAQEEQTLRLTRGRNNSFQTNLTPIELTKRLRHIEGTINGNLYLSMRRQGAPDNIIDSLANVFAFDVDFQRDIFRGDRFEAIYEAFYDKNGTLVRGGDIVFAKLAWRGQTREKDYYFFDPKQSTMRADYYDTKGRSARRLLMKTPIDGARLSSRFGPRRHPILGYRKTHKGVDFAARRGTPIKATGDGVIERANRYGSFGNYVRIRHANGYKTAYAHLKGFSKKARKGRRVRQGDIIGYVGTTGRSTGPHLHYEVHYNGRAVNPQKLKIATGVTLNGKALNGFQRHRARVDRLRLLPETKTAAAR